MTVTSYDFSKNRGMFPKSMLQLYYLFFVIFGFISLLSSVINENPIWMPTLRLIAGFAGLISFKFDFHFKLIALIIGILSTLFGILAWILSKLSYSIIDDTQITIFLIIGTLVIGTAYLYHFEMRDSQFY